MAEDQVGARKDHLHETFLWTRIFGTFKVALDPKKLLLAAAGILVMALGWWILAVVFWNARSEPKDKDYQPSDYGEVDTDEHKREATERANKDYEENKAKYELLKRTAGPGGSLRIWPWVEPRGPNPFLVLENAVRGGSEGNTYQGPEWESNQLLVLIEPLVKFIEPVVYLFNPHAGFWNRIYFFLLILVTLATWALFGAAITRMAVVQYARNEKIGMIESLRFAWARYVSFFSAPLFPIILVAVLAFFLIIYGFFGVLTVFIGDIFIYGLLWPLVILFGLVMAVVLVGLVGWPLMYATVSAEGSDSFDALSRSYSYVYQAPWHYLWYSLVAIAYGAVVVFFVGLMGSLTIYLGKWAVSQAPLATTMKRDPAYLFVWAPTSYGWRDLLLEGTPAVYSRDDYNKTVRELRGEVVKLTKGGYTPRQIDKMKPADREKLLAYSEAEIDRMPPDALLKILDDHNKKAVTSIPKVQDDIRDPNHNFRVGAIRQAYWDDFSIWNYIGAAMVAFWIGLVFLLVVGFGYSYFWSASSIIYLLMRRKVDDTEIDEVHLEEDDMDEAYTPPPPTTTPGTAPASKGPAGTPDLIPSESLTLRSPPGETAPTAPEPPKITMPEPTPPAVPSPTPPPDGGGNSPSSPSP